MNRAQKLTFIVAFTMVLVSYGLFFGISMGVGMLGAAISTTFFHFAGKEVDLISGDDVQSSAMLLGLAWGTLAWGTFFDPSTATGKILGWVIVGLLLWVVWRFRHSIKSLWRVATP